jgi:hypothetical protein
MSFPTFTMWLTENNNKNAAAQTSPSLGLHYNASATK